MDSQFCQHCLEYIPSLDAKLKKNKFVFFSFTAFINSNFFNLFFYRCAQCYQCPSCHNILSSRIQQKQQPLSTDPQQIVTKKLSYYYCYFCRWSSRDIGMPDQSTCNFFCVKHYFNV